MRYQVIYISKDKEEIVAQFKKYEDAISFIEHRDEFSVQMIFDMNFIDGKPKELYSFEEIKDFYVQAKVEAMKSWRIVEI